MKKMDNRRHSRHSATRVAAAVAQEAICTIMSSSADHEFEMSLQSYGNNMTSGKSSRTATKRDSHGDTISGFADGKIDSLGTKSEPNSSGHGIGGNSNSTINSIALTPKRESMFDAYQLWALKTYGDSAKTKTVTKKKYNRIIKILKGEESTNVENSKFRFWVKAKGFRLGPQQLTSADLKLTEQVLYVPCSKSTGSERDETIYKKVAVVENFFDIIYNVHVEMDGRSGRHAGQKRTYKAVAEMYAFLPREAVTRFLMSCSDCQKRMHIQGTNGTNSSCNGITASSKNSSKSSTVRKSLERSSDGGPKTALDIDYSLPLTTTIKRMRNAGFVYNVMGDSLIAPTACLGFDGQDVDEEMISETISGASDADISAHNGDQTTAANSDDALCEEITGDDEDDDDEEEEVVDEVDFDDDAVPLDMSRVKCENTVCFDQPLNMSSKRAKMSTNKIASNGGENGSVGNHGLQERYFHNGTRIVHEEEEDDDDDDNDLQLGDRPLAEQSGSYDPERLKAFNMFVRLFVDENLDRMVPISRQPKEKIQAIIESCTRQFPEFSERARKRIRTYLKSCRRTKRHKTTGIAGGNENGRAWNESSQASVKTGTSNHVSYHLTSPMAEQILATACDNECQNAKRMRMGLKPIANEVSSAGNSTVHTCNPTSTSASAVQVFQQSATNPNLLTFPYQQCISGENSGSALATGPNVNVSTNSKSNGNHYSLNPSEVAAVKQLIAGYRESAAFLLRSADELEQLILQQN